VRVRPPGTIIPVQALIRGVRRGHPWVLDDVDTDHCVARAADSSRRLDRHVLRKGHGATTAPGGGPARQRRSSFISGRAGAWRLRRGNLRTNSGKSKRVRRQPGGATARDAITCSTDSVLTEGWPTRRPNISDSSACPRSERCRELTASTRDDDGGERSKQCPD